MDFFGEPGPNESSDPNYKCEHTLIKKQFMPFNGNQIKTAVRYIYNA